MEQNAHSEYVEECVQWDIFVRKWLALTHFGGVEAFRGFL